MDSSLTPATRPRRPKNGQGAAPHTHDPDSRHDNLLGVLRVLYRWRRTIRNVCLAVLAGAVVITLLMPNYYRATTIFYPASPELANPELIFGYTGDVTEYFGSDRDLDRLAEIANSNEVVDYIVQRFRLYDHYDIDSSGRQGPYKVRKRFHKLYTAEKNKYDAVELSIEDTDPKLAADMANAARGKIDEIAQRLTKSSQSKLLATFEDNISRKNIELKTLGDSLRHMQSKYNIYNVATQSEQLALELSTAESDIARYRGRLEILEGNARIPRDTISYIKANLRASERTLQRLMTNDSTVGMSLPRFNEASAQISVLSDLHFQARKQLSYDLERYNQIKAAYNTDIPALHLVETAEVPLIKSRPKRSILVLAAVVAAFLFTALGVLLAENYRDVRWREVLEG